MENPLTERVLCRMNARTKTALDAYAAKKGYGGAGSALRIMAIEALTAAGLLPGGK